MDEAASLYSARSHVLQWTSHQRDMLTHMWQVPVGTHAPTEIRTDLIAHMSKPFYARFQARLKFGVGFASQSDVGRHHIGVDQP